ncbi:hypothetical protein EV421DRAFT_1743447 [Armillaria borealis]|uniref:Uncharacterized protein n=1 Tax=Armillaria borealis TaxID=47425 RepID=A0AA39MDQ7_9AGAR|nr:hypothetical protein EV421DRAFT_1743447 [Armillaria borealis]
MTVGTKGRRDMEERMNTGMLVMVNYSHPANIPRYSAILSPNIVPFCARASNPQASGLKLKSLAMSTTTYRVQDGGRIDGDGSDGGDGDKDKSGAVGGNLPRHMYEHGDTIKAPFLTAGGDEDDIEKVARDVQLHGILDKLSSFQVSIIGTSRYWSRDRTCAHLFTIQLTSTRHDAEPARSKMEGSFGSSVAPAARCRRCVYERYDRTRALTISALKYTNLDVQPSPCTELSSFPEDTDAELRFVTVERGLEPMLRLEEVRRRETGWQKENKGLYFNILGIAGDNTKDPARTGGFKYQVAPRKPCIVASPNYTSPPAQH